MARDGIPESTDDRHEIRESLSFADKTNDYEAQPETGEATDVPPDK